MKFSDINFKCFKGSLLLGGFSSLVFGGMLMGTVAGCNAKNKTKTETDSIPWTPIKPAKIKASSIKKPKLVIEETLKHFDKEHPFCYDYWKYFKDEPWGVDFDTPKAKELFIEWFFPKIPNDKVIFEQTEDLCFVKRATQKVYADYNFSSGSYNQISFWIKDISNR